jgi:hypothetical protein
MDIARLIRDRLRDALDRKDGQTNIVISGNVGESGHSTTVYSDDDVTIIERDGERHVIRHTPPSDE